MLPSPSELQYLVEVGNTLNLSRAAERLGISQPTLSLAIQRLEDNFGTPLLIRTKSGVKLTHAGQKLITQARFLMHEWERVRTEVLKGEEELRGRYTLGCHPSVALFTLPFFIPELLKDNPHLEFKLIHDLSRKITEDVISFKTDFAVVVNPWEHPDLIIKPLWKDEVTLWTHKKPSTLQDPSSGTGVLICDPELVQSQEILKQISKAGMKFERTITSSNLEVIASLTAAKSGVGLLPSRVVAQHHRDELQPLAKAPHFTDKHCLIYRADAQRSKSNRVLAKAIETLLLSEAKPAGL